MTFKEFIRQNPIQKIADLESIIKMTLEALKDRDESLYSYVQELYNQYKEDYACEELSEIDYWDGDDSHQE